MKVGDQIKMKTGWQMTSEEITIYTILEIDKHSITVSHPNLGGYFIFSIDMVDEIIKEND